MLSPSCTSTEFQHQAATLAFCCIVAWRDFQNRSQTDGKDVAWMVWNRTCVLVVGEPCFGRTRCPTKRRHSGDSYTSTGFSIQGPQPDKSNPLGNPAYPGFTSSDGPNYVDFLTTTYNRSYIQTYNHAFGGATVDPTLVPSPFGPIVQSFKQQVEHGFLPNYASRDTVPWSSSKSLFTVFFGINDVVLSYEQKNDTLNYTIIKSYENLVHKASHCDSFLCLEPILIGYLAVFSWCP